MTASAPTPPTPIDPRLVIDEQARVNRVNKVGPFGSVNYGPDGTQTTSLSPGMQGVVDNQTSLASKPYHMLEKPQGFNDLQDAIMSKVGNHYGGGGQKQAGQQMPQIGNIDGKQTNPAMQAALEKIWGQH